MARSGGIAPLAAAVTAALALTAALLTGCAGPASEPGPAPTSAPTAEPTADDRPLATPILVIAAADVPALLDEGAALIAVGSTLEASQPGYLDGALAVDQDDWHLASDSQAELDDTAGWSQRIGALGIAADRPVVVYDDGELKFASRVRYLLAHFGVEETYLVDGGWPALETVAADHGIATAGSPAAPEPVGFQATITQPPIPVATRDVVAEAVAEGGAVILDVRSPEEFDGARLLPPVTRGGHIPGAVNLPMTELLDPATAPSSLLPIEELREVFAARGIEPGDGVIVYCQDGARSSLVASALVMAGYSHTELYYLSYADWQSDTADPVAQ
ncbi:MAG: sulfurtransferase [Microbacteriaceae bacterium]|nr:sulfurtransferase [Microbacteriaceae bacterium]